MSPLDAVLEALPRCTACQLPGRLPAHPATLERPRDGGLQRVAGVDDDLPEVFRCVGCGAEWEAAEHEAKRAARAELAYLRDTRQTSGDLRRALRAQLERDVERVRAMFVDAGKPLPSWLTVLERGAA